LHVDYRGFEYVAIGDWKIESATGFYEWQIENQRKYYVDSKIAKSAQRQFETVRAFYWTIYGIGVVDYDSFIIT